jgi:hypothetical protein
MGDVARLSGALAPAVLRPNRRWRSFAVEAYAGRRIAGWPLGRFDVGAEGLQVRLRFPWFVTRSSGKDATTRVSVARAITGVCVRFEDSGQRLADVHVHLPVRAQRIIDELRQYGYAITDRKTGHPVVRTAAARGICLAFSGSQPIAF